MIYKINHYILDTRRYRIERNDKGIAVEPKIFDLLVFLIENRDRVVIREEFLEELWKGQIVTDSALGAWLKGARKAIGDDGKKQIIIKTVHGRGYQFIGTVHQSRPKANGLLRDCMLLLAMLP